MFEADEAAVAGELLDMAFDPALMEVGEELSFLHDGYPPKLLKQLKRGHFSVQDDLDLHHMNAAAAQASIAGFPGRGARQTGCAACASCTARACARKPPARCSRR